MAEQLTTGGGARTGIFVRETPGEAAPAESAAPPAAAESAAPAAAAESAVTAAAAESAGSAVKERFEGVAELPPEVLYFEGHFPGDPILPGMAQLMCLVVEPAMVRWADLGPACGLSKVKFRRPVRPGDALRIVLERQGSGAVRFNVACGDDDVASGVVLFGEASP